MKKILVTVILLCCFSLSAQLNDNNLSATKISGYLDGNYSALTDIEIFKIYPKEDVSKNLKEILYNAILGKASNINMYGNLYYFIGNLPKLIHEYGIESNVVELYKSFNLFLELSLLNEVKTTS